jgi:hypothetical protein
MTSSRRSRLGSIWLLKDSPPVPVLLAVIVTVLLTFTVPARAAGSDAGFSLTGPAGAPLAGATVASPFDETLAYPAGVTPIQVKWYVDNVFIGQTDTAPWTWPASINPGAHTLKARATLADGTSKQAVAGVIATVPAAPVGLPGPPIPAGPFTTVPVSTAAQLQTALNSAQPGDRITLADGVYSANFTLTASGTDDRPITVEGGPGAELVSPSGNDGGSYALHLTGAHSVRLTGFSVHTAKKGIVLDGSTGVVMDRLHVYDIGDEGVHFRAFSSDNWLTASIIEDTGHANDGFGEGVYLGSASGNWPTFTRGQPDRSDRNSIIGNIIQDTTAENIDVKEGTTGGMIAGNTLDGASLSGANSADSNIDVKGSDYLITENMVTGSRGNAFEGHVPILGWGSGNWYSRNILTAASTAAGIWSDGTAAHTGNIITCDNTVTGAAVAYATTNNAPLTCVA